MTGSETDAPTSMEKQFEDFRVKLDEAGSLRERIRAVVNEIESTTRLMHASLLHVHQSRPLSGNKITWAGLSISSSVIITASVSFSSKCLQKLFFE